MNKHKHITSFLTLLLGISIGWFAHEKNNSLVSITDMTTSSIIAADHQLDKPAKIISQQVDLSTKNLQALLDQHQLELAISLFESLQLSDDISLHENAQDIILTFARKLVFEQRYETAKKLLTLYLTASNRDVEGRLILAETHHKMNAYQQAITVLYEAKGHAYIADDLNKINQKIRTLVSKQALRHKKNMMHYDLLVMYEQLTQQEPEYAPYFIRLAEAQSLLHNFEAAISSLQMVTQDPGVGLQAQTLLIELQEKLQVAAVIPPPETNNEITELPLYKKGNNFLIDGFTNRNDSLRMLIDTGASLTIITPNALEKYNIEYKETGEKRLFNTANGAVHAPIYQLETFSVGKWQVNNIEVAALDLHDSIDGLLGMNFLQHFQFFIDQENALLRLSPRK
jgi:clan AA aspartic protease (TIGR02281 family)